MTLSESIRGIVRTEPPETRRLCLALLYAEHGWSVFPLGRDSKKPAIKGGNGCDDATTNPETIREWWTADPSRNIGIACGPSGLAVIDPDLYKRGVPETWAELSAQLGPLETFSVKTPRGGVHFYTKTNGTPIASGNGWRNGIDVKAAGGYVVAAGSTWNGRTYEPDSPFDVADLPPSWTAALPKPKAAGSASTVQPAQRQTHGADDTATPFGSGEDRHRAMLSVAGSLRNRGLDRAEILAALRALDAEACDPPTDPAGRARELEGIAKASSGWEAKPAPVADPDPRTAQILVGPDLADMTDKAEAALAARPDLGIYSRGTALVRVVCDQARRLRWLTRPPGAPSIALAEQPWLREQMGRAAQWWGTGRDGKPRAVQPPTVVAQTLMARMDWTFPPLEAVAESPLFLPTGDVLDVPGYHDETGLLLTTEPGEFPRVSASPSAGDVTTALDLLCDPLQDFPFLADGDRSVVLAAVLSILARQAIDGPVPAFAFRSSTPGSGKTLLADVVATITSGNMAPRMAQPFDDDETRKRILSIGLEGLPLILVDNCTGAVGSRSLAAALTATTWSDRVLGRSEKVTVPLRAVWLVSGNNLTFRGDLGRRVVPCDIDPGCEFPEDRTGFVYDNLLDHVRRHRRFLVAAGLTILRAYHVAGRPSHGKPVKGSFEAWDRLVRGALVWAGAADPLSTVERVRAEGDEDRDRLVAGLSALADAYPPAEAFTAADALSRADQDPELHAALCAFAGCDARRLDARMLSRSLRSAAGRIVGRKRLERASTSRRLVRWRVVEA